MRNFNGAARTARSLLLEFAVFLSAGLSGTSFAQYPDKPVLLIVGSGAGGINDIIARIVAEHMTKSLGQQVNVENRPGAGTTLAISAIAKAPADGYTLLVNGSSDGVVAVLYPYRGSTLCETSRASRSWASYG